MKNVAIYGAGGFGRETACLLREVNEAFPGTWNFVGFFDDGIPAGTKNSQGQVLGGIEALNARNGELALVIAIASPRVIETLVGKITNPNITFPNIIAPSARIMDPATLTIGHGNIINWTCSLSTDTRIGNFNLMNGNVTVGHDVSIGDFNTFMTGTRIAGELCIGNRNRFGANCSVYQGINIGNDTVVGSCSLVVHPTKDGNTYIGNPAVRFKF